MLELLLKKVKKALVKVNSKENLIGITTPN